MGAWGTGPFDNDAAANFLGELDSAPARSITEALKTVSKLPHGQSSTLMSMMEARQGRLVSWLRCRSDTVTHPRWTMLFLTSSVV